MPQEKNEIFFAVFVETHRGASLQWHFLHRFRPCVLQRHGAVEDQMVRRAVLVHREVANALELEVVERLGVG